MRNEDLKWMAELLHEKLDLNELSQLEEMLDKEPNGLHEQVRAILVVEMPEILHEED